MSGPWASVVVPVYNTEKWLPEALESIDRQGCRDRLEVLVIDDGSPDDSGRIAQEYAAKAPGVRYVRQANAGLGAARNHGVRLATGRYLAFLDSDDIYPADGLHDLLRLADEHDAQIAVGDMHGLPPRPSPRWRRELMSGTRLIKHLSEAPDIVGNPSACNKVFRRDFVLSTGVEFTEGTAFEDVLFTLPLMMQADRTVLTPRLAYLYRLRGDGTSIMDARSQPKKIFQHLGIVERLAGELDGVTDEGTRHAVYRWIAYMQLHYAKLAAESLDDAQLTEFAGRMAALFEDIPVETSSEFASASHVGMRAVGVYEQDPATIRQPRSGAPLRVRHGQLYLGHAEFDRYQHLLRINQATATFSKIKPGEPPVIEGNAHLPGISATPGEVREDLLLEVGDTLVRRPIVVRALTEHGLRWSCAIPLDEVGTGTHRLQLLVRDQGREFPLSPGGDTWGTGAISLPDGRTARIRHGIRAPRLVITGTRLAAALHSPAVAAVYVGRRGQASLKYRGKQVLRRVVPSLRQRKTR
ncbi:glycosyltransferase family 2 protein [Micromonospora sp. NPDC049559]|uniref:glycosyltransferase family 2 protein n=1 Tax=Micromonospora sp. NPDC049559 TaxID=3155923 RepID=UPI00342807D1